MNKKIHLAILFLTIALLSAPYRLAAQEFVFPLSENPVIKNYTPVFEQAFKRQTTDTLTLPFFDDFSSSHIYPSQKLWLDQFVFINNTFAVDPVSVGVATFDGMNSEGDRYAIAGKYGSADTLTSSPLNLELQPSDSVYLSFLYQPQGKGREPGVKDSLLLEFKNIGTGAWELVWSAKGTKVHPFKQVLISITQSNFLYKGFQFRFRNKAELAGSLDHWNVDYIKLDKNRSATDTLLNDIAFTSDPSSILQHFEAMPYNQFTSSDLKNTTIGHSVKIRNNFNQTKALNYLYNTIEVRSGSAVSGSQRGIPLEPLSESDEGFAPYVINYGTEKFLLYTTYELATDNSDYSKWNDTVKREQPFDDYYAYDDGTAENGYGLAGAGAMLACKFWVNNPDTLTGVNMAFVKIGKDVSNELFSITVWEQDKGNGKPGKILYQKTGQTPGKAQSVNGFSKYTTDSVVMVSDTFFVGWVQSSKEILSVGFDNNKNNNDKIYYNVSSDGWLNSTLGGTLMIRPVFADKTGTPLAIPESKAGLNLNVFPNPAKDEIHLQFDSEEYADYHFEIINTLGQVVKSEKLIRSIHIGDLQRGVYLLKLINSVTTDSGNTKFIKE